MDRILWPCRQRTKRVTWVTHQHPNFIYLYTVDFFHTASTCSCATSVTGLDNWRTKADQPEALGICLFQLKSYHFRTELGSDCHSLKWLTELLHVLQIESCLYLSPGINNRITFELEQKSLFHSESTHITYHTSHTSTILLIWSVSDWSKYINVTSHTYLGDTICTQHTSFRRGTQYCMNDVLKPQEWPCAHVTKVAFFNDRSPDTTSVIMNTVPIAQNQCQMKSMIVIALQVNLTCVIPAATLEGILKFSWFSPFKT